MFRWSLIACCALLSFSISAASPLCGSRPIRLAFFDYGLYYSHGVGIDKDLVEVLQKRSGCSFDVQVQARARTWEELLLFRNLAAHRVEGAIADPLVYHLALEPAQLARMTIEDWIPSQPSDPVNLVFSKKRFDGAAAEEWRELIRQLIADGTMTEIFRRYLPAAEAERLVGRK